MIGKGLTVREAAAVIKVSKTALYEALRTYNDGQDEQQWWFYILYCDPPYLHSTRGDSKAYGFEMSEDQHREFAEAVNECKGMVAVSGYDHSLMDDLFKPDKWFKTFGSDKTIHSTKGTRTEVLWTNYDPKKL